MIFDKGNVEKAFTPSALEYDPTIPARYMARLILHRSVLINLL